MQVTQPGGQPSNFESDVTWWPNFDPICNKSEDAYLNEIQIRFSFFAENFVRKGGWGYPPYGQNPQSSIWRAPLAGFQML